VFDTGPAAAAAAAAAARSVTNNKRTRTPSNQSINQSWHGLSWLGLAWLVLRRQRWLVGWLFERVRLMSQVIMPPDNTRPFLENDATGRPPAAATSTTSLCFFPPSLIFRLSRLPKSAMIK
jgi:hypothetical protein